MVKLLKKANNELISWCECEDAIAAYPGQLDCPWCGCGWLFSCHKCRKAFTFAVVQDLDVSVKQLAREDMEARGMEYDKDLEEEWIDYMDYYVGDFEVGTRCVYFDGSVFPIDSAPIKFEGWFASHDFDRLPHAVAKTGDQLREHEILKPDYWFQREVADRE